MRSCGAGSSPSSRAAISSPAEFVKTRKQTIEAVCSIASAWVQVYEQHFVARPIAKSPETAWLASFLLGYPPGCLKRHIAYPHRRPITCLTKSARSCFTSRARNAKWYPGHCPPTGRSARSEKMVGTITS